MGVIVLWFLCFSRFSPSLYYIKLKKALDMKALPKTRLHRLGVPDIPRLQIQCSTQYHPDCWNLAELGSFWYYNLEYHLHWQSSMRWHAAVDIGQWYGWKLTTHCSVTQIKSKLMWNTLATTIKMMHPWHMISSRCTLCWGVPKFRDASQNLGTYAFSCSKSLWLFNLFCQLFLKPIKRDKFLFCNILYVCQSLMANSLSKIVFNN